MQPTGNFTMPESPPPGYMSEDSEYADSTVISSPSSSVGFSGKILIIKIKNLNFKLKLHLFTN